MSLFLVLIFLKKGEKTLWKHSLKIQQIERSTSPKEKFENHWKKTKKSLKIIERKLVISNSSKTKLPLNALKARQTILVLSLKKRDYLETFPKQKRAVNRETKKVKKLHSEIQNLETNTAQKIKFSIQDFFSKCDQIRSFLRIWSHLLKKSLMENFIFSAV